MNARLMMKRPEIIGQQLTTYFYPVGYYSGGINQLIADIRRDFKSDIHIEILQCPTCGKIVMVTMPCRS